MKNDFFCCTNYINCLLILEVLLFKKKYIFLLFSFSQRHFKFKQYLVTFLFTCQQLDKLILKVSSHLKLLKSKGKICLLICVYDSTRFANFSYF